MIKNMDDIAFFADSLADLEKNNEYLRYSKEKNLKLKTSKYKISEHVEFAGAKLSAKLVQGKQLVIILPIDGNTNAFRNLKHPETKSELRS